ncbi:acyltransferase family protein [Pseudomonas bohemica]|uniref:acyltransferase family protein n=1 Tax=Pseudomonas bohemica TaxID=2044872 RepID=UPI000DA63A20|nr:acyltransferase [Pseudomonas bohemica]
MELTSVSEKLPVRLSVYFDILRVFAALLVMVSHYPLTVGMYGVLSRTNFAYDAVVVFFVLSGYVISYSANVLESGVKEFTVNRIARIMPVAAAAIAFSGICFSIYSGARPDLYGESSSFSPWWVIVFQSLSFTNQAWTANDMPFSNGPYWSLAFEVWCYIAFAVLFYARGFARVVLFFAILALLGPKQLIILPMWFAGVAAYRFRNSLDISKRALKVFVLLPVVVYFAVQIPMPRDWSYVYVGRYVESFLGFGLDGAANFGWGYILSALVALHIYAFGKLSQGASMNMESVFVRLVRFLSSYTFTLYLFHMPIFKLILSVAGKNMSDFGAVYRLSVYLVTFVIVYFIGNVVEHRKKLYREWGHNLLNVISPIFRPRLKT